MVFLFRQKVSAAPDTRRDEISEVLVLVGLNATSLRDLRIPQYTDEELDLLEMQRFLANRQYERAVREFEVKKGVV
jgi:hypothetical protein